MTLFAFSDGFWPSTFLVVILSLKNTRLYLINNRNNVHTNERGWREIRLERDLRHRAVLAAGEIEDLRHRCRWFHRYAASFFVFDLRDCSLHAPLNRFGSFFYISFTYFVLYDARVFRTREIERLRERERLKVFVKRIVLIV
jgi:hypothetical protein